MCIVLLVATDISPMKKRYSGGRSRMIIMQADAEPVMERLRV